MVRKRARKWADAILRDIYRFVWFRSAPQPTSVVHHRSSHKSHQRKNVISCVSVGDSDEETQQSPKHQTYQSTRVTPVIYPHTPNVQHQPVSVDVCGRLYRVSVLIGVQARKIVNRWYSLRLPIRWWMGHLVCCGRGDSLTCILYFSQTICIGSPKVESGRYLQHHQSQGPYFNTVPSQIHIPTLGASTHSVKHEPHHK